MGRLLVFLLPVVICCIAARAADAPDPRPRVIIETDAGGDPDDEQSLVRLLLYANDLDIQGIIANRPVAVDRENLNTERTGLGIVRRMLAAYGQCHANLVVHDKRYPTQAELEKRTVAGYDEIDDGVKLIIAAVDSADPRPLWFCNWGTINGSAESSLKRALDRILKERGREGYAKFKSRIYLSSDDQFGDHISKIEPPFPIWIDTFRPELDRKRWYHRFSALTAKAGGFDLQRDCLTGHGPLGALYPTNTTHPQKEGDTMTFLYLIPTGLNDPIHPDWGSWAGRYGPRETYTGKPYYWANQPDMWEGTTHRDNTVARWAANLQNDFRTRLNWCVTKDYSKANHPPVVRLGGPNATTVKPGDTITLDATNSTDHDKHELRFRWIFYPEPGTYRGEPPRLEGGATARASFTAPEVKSEQTLHVLLIATDTGDPPLTRYVRVVVTLRPR